MTRERSSPGGILGPTGAHSASDLVAKFGFLLPNTLLHTLLHFCELYRTTPALHSLQRTFTSTMQSILLHTVGVPCCTINHHIFCGTAQTTDFELPAPFVATLQIMVSLRIRSTNTQCSYSPLNHSQISLKIFQSSRDS